MFIAILLMVVGIVVGRLLRKGIRISLSPVIMLVISLLLFVLGLELGFNENLVSQFTKLGVSAIVIALLSVLGSCIAAWFFYRMTVERRKGNA